MDSSPHRARGWTAPNGANRSMRKLTGWKFLMGLAVLALFAAPAYADNIVFDLTNTNLSGITSPYVQVTVNRTSSTTAIVTFTTSFAGAGGSYVIGDHLAADLNVNGSFSAACGANCISIGGSSNVDGMGTYNLTSTEGSGFSSPVTTLVIDLTATGANSWSSASNVLTGVDGSGGTNGSAAAHIAPTSNLVCTGYTSDVASASGAGSGGNCSSVPEPSTLLQAGTGLSGVGLLALFGSGMPALRRRFQVHDYPLSNSRRFRVFSAALRNVRRVGRVSVCS